MLLFLQAAPIGIANVSGMADLDRQVNISRGTVVERPSPRGVGHPGVVAFRRKPSGNGCAFGNLGIVPVGPHHFDPSACYRPALLVFHQPTDDRSLGELDGESLRRVLVHLVPMHEQRHVTVARIHQEAKDGEIARKLDNGLAAGITLEVLIHLCRMGRPDPDVDLRAGQRLVVRPDDVYLQVAPSRRVLFGRFIRRVHLRGRSGANLVHIDVDNLCLSTNWISNPSLS